MQSASKFRVTPLEQVNYTKRYSSEPQPKPNKQIKPSILSGTSSALPGQDMVLRPNNNLPWTEGSSDKFVKSFLANCRIGECAQEDTEVLLRTSRCILSTCLLIKAKPSRTESPIPVSVQKWTWADHCWCKQALSGRTKYCKCITEQVFAHTYLPGFWSWSAMGSAGFWHQLNTNTVACSLSVTPKENLACLI